MRRLSPRRREGDVSKRRNWWLVSRGISGALSQRYHWVDRAANRTACGIELGEAFGLFTSIAHSGSQQLKLRCDACVEQRRPPKKDPQS